jgi:hypothetical protein
MRTSQLHAIDFGLNYLTLCECGGCDIVVDSVRRDNVDEFVYEPPKSGFFLLIAYNLPHIINSTKKHDSRKQQRRNGKYVNKFSQ